MQLSCKIYVYAHVSITCVLWAYPLSLMNCCPADMAALRSAMLALGPGWSQIKDDMTRLEFSKTCRHLTLPCANRGC